MGLFRNAASLLVTAVASAPIVLVISIILTHFLTPNDFGEYRIAMASAGVLILLGRLGWPSAAIFRLRRVGAAPDRVASAALGMALLVSVLALLVSVAFAERVSAWLLKDAPTGILLLAVAAVPFQLTALYFNGIARGLDRFALQNWYRFLTNLGRLAAIAGVILLAGGGLREVLIASLVVHAVTGTGLVLSVLRLTGLRPRPDLAEVAPTLRYGVKAWVHGLAGNLHERVDVFMLAFLLQDPAQVAFYAIAASVVDYMKRLPESVAVAVLPQLSALDPQHAGALASTALRHTLLWVGLSILAAAPVGSFALPLVYGSDYAASVTPFLILLLGFASLAVYRVLVRYFLAIDRQAVNVASQIFSAGVNVGLNFWLIPRYGIAGAAIASVASYGLEALILVVAFVRSTGLGVRELLVIRRSDFEAYRSRIAPRLRALGLTR